MFELTKFSSGTFKVRIAVLQTESTKLQLQLQLPMASPFFIAFNVLYQLATLITLWVFNKDLNDDFIPSRFMQHFGKNGRATTLSTFTYFFSKMFILVGEAALLILIVTVINQVILRASVSSKKRKAIAGQTVRTNLIINFCYIILLMWGHFMAGLW